MADSITRAETGGSTSKDANAYVQGGAPSVQELNAQMRSDMGLPPLKQTPIDREVGDTSNPPLVNKPKCPVCGSRRVFIASRSMKCKEPGCGKISEHIPGV